MSFDLHLTQWNAAQRARQAPSAAWSAVHFARPARTPKSQAHGISMIAAVATAVWLGRAARIASWPAVVTRSARGPSGVDRRCGWFGGQRRPCVTITRAVVAIRRCRRLLTAAGADSARRTAEGPCMAHGPWRPGSHASVVSRSLVADPPFFCGLTPARKLSFVG